MNIIDKAALHEIESVDHVATPPNPIGDAVQHRNPTSQHLIPTTQTPPSFCSYHYGTTRSLVLVPRLMRGVLHIADKTVGDSYEYHPQRTVTQNR